MANDVCKACSWEDDRALALNSNDVFHFPSGILHMNSYRCKENLEKARTGILQFTNPSFNSAIAKPKQTMKKLCKNVFLEEPNNDRVI